MIAMLGLPAMNALFQIVTPNQFPRPDQLPEPADGAAPSGWGWGRSSSR